MWHVVSDGGWTPIRCAALRIVSLRAWFGMWTPESSKAIASRIALKPAVVRDVPLAGAARRQRALLHGGVRQVELDPLLAVDRVDVGLRAAVGTGILLSRSGWYRTPGDTLEHCFYSTARH